MKKQITRLIFIFALSLPGLCLADETVIQSLIYNYGVDNLIEVILDKRFGEITIDKNGSFVNSFGKPNKSHINSKTIIKDLEKAGLDVAKFTALVEKHVEKKLGKKARLQKEVVTPSSKPSGTTSSGVTVRYGKADQKCVAACKKKLDSCQQGVNKDSKKCKSEADVEKCLDENSYAARQCSNKYSSCEDNCYEKVIKK